MAKKTFYGTDARDRVLAGAKIVHDVVSSTLGPKGQNVVISRPNGTPTITHDGVTAAKSVSVADIDDGTLGYGVGVEIVKAAALKMEKVGDGTSTTTILTYHIMNEANKLIAAGYSPMDLRKQIESVTKTVIDKINDYSEDISDKPKRVAQVASISAGDPDIGELIADVMAKIGVDGSVTVEAGQGLEMESEITKGYSLGKGYASPYMVTNGNTMEAVYKNVPILVTDAKLTSAQDLIPLLEEMNTTSKRNLVIIADDISGDALGMLVFNKIKGTFNTVVVKAPSFGDRRQQMLEDIAIVTGATFISTERGHTITGVKVDDLGSARQVIVTADNTTIVDGSGVPEDIASRSMQLETLAQNSTSDYDREFYEKRRASMDGKVAVIRVGGATETEIEEKKFRVDDAVAAAKSAMKSGIVPGGEVTLVNVSQAVQKEEKDQDSPGANIVLKALEQPFRVLLNNAGLNPDEWLPQVRTKSGHGVDVMSMPGSLVDMKKVGVIDPTEVAKNALQGAASIAAAAITMGALVVDLPVKEDSVAPQQPMPMM